jgi:hypothetical protein
MEARKQLEEQNARATKLSESNKSYKLHALESAQKFIDACRQWRIDADRLLHVAQSVRVVMETVDLPPGELDNEGVASISKFFADMVGKLEALNLRVVARLEHEGKDIARQLASIILPQVHYLTPDFPFHLLLDDFEDDEDHVAAKAAVATYIAEVKEMMKRV